MIHQVYICDLCGDAIGRDCAQHKRESARRIYFASGGPGHPMTLHPLVYNGASEKVICGPCLEGLKKALWEPK